EVFGADISMVQGLRLFGGEEENFLGARSVWDIAEHLLVGTSADQVFDLRSDVFQTETDLLQNIHRDALPQLNQAEQHVLSSYKIVIKAVSFAAREGEDLLSPRCERIHRDS